MSVMMQFETTAMCTLYWIMMVVDRVSAVSVCIEQLHVSHSSKRPPKKILPKPAIGVHHQLSQPSPDHLELVRLDEPDHPHPRSQQQTGLSPNHYTTQTSFSELNKWSS
jgi:hypothetical protein